MIFFLNFCADETALTGCSLFLISKSYKWSHSKQCAGNRAPSCGEDTCTLISCRRHSLLHRADWCNLFWGRKWFPLLCEFIRSSAPASVQSIMFDNLHSVANCIKKLVVFLNSWKRRSTKNVSHTNEYSINIYTWTACYLPRCF